MQSTSAESRPQARTALPLDVEGRLVRVRHDPLLSPLDLVAHELVEHEVRLLRILERDAPERSRGWVEGRVPELLRVHLTESFVPRDRGLTPALPVVGAFIGIRRGDIGLVFGLLRGTTTS